MSEARRGLRDTAWGKALILVVILVAALLVARSCGKTDPNVSQDEAVEIARAEVPFEPNDVVIRFQKRGLTQDEYWLVGLGIKNADGTFERATNVLVDASSGEVADVEPVDVGG